MPTLPTVPRAADPTAHALPRTHPLEVLVVDDHQLFRIGLRRLLEEEGFLVTDADTAEAALRRSAGRAPDVVLIGVNRPAAPGGDVIRLVLDAAPSAAVLVLAQALDEAHAVQAVQAGAVGYLLKDAALAQIVAGIRDAASGHSALAPPVARVLIDRLRCPAGTAAPLAHAPHRLSERERAVLGLLASGCDNSEIGDRLFVSRSTVKNHVASLFEKLDVDNRVQAATYAVRAGLASSPPPEPQHRASVDSALSRAAA